MSGLTMLLDAGRFEVQQHLDRVWVLPIVIIYLNNVCDSQCITCSIWKNNDFLKISSDRQMPEAMLQELYATLGKWRPRQILLSGGEPVLHPGFAEAVMRFRDVAPKVCVITNGLLLATCEPAILQSVAEFYISFDAPDSDGYRQIRGVDGYSRLADSMKALTALRRRPKAVARCTLQRENIRRIPQLIAAARQLGFDAISFLAVDISSKAFSRDVHGIPDAAGILPTRDDLAHMERDIHSMDTASSNFTEGGPDKLDRILHYFRAVLGEGQFPAVRCNAPWASIVIETTGKIRGCFFQPLIGDFRSVNGDMALRFRRSLNVSRDATCQRCVCSKLVRMQDLIRM